MVGGLGGATAAPDAGAGARGDFDPPRQPTHRFLGLCAGRPRRRRPPPGGERGDVPPLDACAPPPAASVADPGGGLRVSRAPDPPIPRVAASLTGLPPVALALVSRHADAARIGVFLLGGEIEKMSTELVRTRCYSYICSGISPSKTVRLHALLRARRRETLFHSLVWPRNIGHNSFPFNENSSVLYSKL